MGLRWPLLAAVGLRWLSWASSYVVVVVVVVVVQPADVVTNIRDVPNRAQMTPDASFEPVVVNKTEKKNKKKLT